MSDYESYDSFKLNTCFNRSLRCYFIIAKLRLVRIHLLNLCDWSSSRFFNELYSEFGEKIIRHI